jgi:hypothetical protein
MANSDKDILITPNNNVSGLPEIRFTGFGNSSLSLVVADDNTGKINFVSSGATAFSIDTNVNNGVLLNVADRNSVPLLEISDTNSLLGYELGTVSVEGDGIVLPSYGTTALPIGTPEGTIVYDDNHQVAKVYNGTVWTPIGGRKNGLTADTAAESTEQLITDYPDSPTGFYWILVDRIPQLFWVDMVYEGGGWILVLNNRINTNGMTGLNYQSATTRVINYRGNYYSATGNNPTNFNLWVGLDAWVKLANANFSTSNRVVEFVASAYQPLGAVHQHTKRASWDWSGWGGAYAWQGLANTYLELGGSLPGLYSYHAANGYNLTTFDVDQDVAGNNCSTAYFNQPNWYGACWSGSPFGGGGSGSHADAWFWDSSTSDYHNYGALYVR